jgi:hypothetical protein
MHKYKLMALVVFAAILVSSEAHGDRSNRVPKTATASGKVSTVDMESGIIRVDVESKPVVFYLLHDSQMFMGTHHMTTIEIMQGDPVIVLYNISSGKNNIISLVDKRDET